ncbi:MAG: hypothetical protein EA391_08190 [Balneolaceae bacterium]|nr:MAG: hypothetical protein EA391_08190 [Balneolaceae bacterium]
MYRPFLILALLFGSLFFTHEINARQAQTDTEQTLLPEIDPQDIEIRSQFQARFPGLRRQPILGFNPRPRVFQIDPNRIPFIEDHQTVAANLPIGTLDRPEAPEYQRLGYADPRYAFFRGGIGTYISPEADLFAVARLSDKNWISGSANFESSDGHISNFPSSYRYFNTDIRSFNRLSKRTQLNFSAGFTSNFNHMPMLSSGFGQFFDNDEAGNGEFFDIDTRVSKTGFHGAADFVFAQTSLSGVNVHISGYGNDYSLDSSLNPLSGVANEWGLNIAAGYSRLGNNINEIHRLKISSRIGDQHPVLDNAGVWTVSTISAHYERLFNYRTDVKVSLGASGVTDAADDFTFRFKPDIEIKHTFFTGFSMRGHAYGKENHYSFADVKNQNRFFDFSTPLRHQYQLKALGEVLLEPFFGTKIIGGTSYQNISNYLYFQREIPAVQFHDDLEIAQRYFSATFSDVTIFRIYGGISQDLRPEVFWVSADGHWQIPRLDGGDKIPFVENLSIKGTASFRPASQVLLEGWGEFMSGRENHRGDSMPTFFTLGAKFEVSLSERFGVYGKMRNILNEEYEIWSGYPERGFQAFVGFNYIL